MREVPDYSLYIENYDQQNAGPSLSGRMMQWGHAALEGMLPVSYSAPRVLEVGAGSGHHYRYVTHRLESYVMTDASPRMLEHAASTYAAQAASGRLHLQQQDAKRLTFEDQSFDRLIATHVLEHIPDPVVALREWNRVVKPGGLISLILPCDPGVLWRLGRCFGPRRAALRVGLPYDYLMAAEHVNSIFNLRTFIRYHFEAVIESWYPFKVPLADVNLFYCCHITKP